MKLSRSAALGLGVVIWFGARQARADMVIDPLADGQELARQGDFAGAVKQFLRADQRTPTPDTACLLGLAEHRRGEPGQAEQWFALCHARATSSAPVPTWADAIERELAAKLAGMPSITVRVEPPSEHASITIDGWDGPLHTRVVHVAPGRYTFGLREVGGERAAATIAIASGEARVLVLTPPAPTVARAVEEAKPLPPPAPLRHDEPSHVRTSTIVIGAGVLALAVGGVLDVTLVNSTRHKLKGVTLDEYNAHLDAYRQAQIGTIAVLSVGAAAVITGLVLRSRERSPTAPQLGAIVGPHGGLVTVGWSR